MNERFSYRGSAAIGGVTLPNVVFQETTQDGGLQSWEGAAAVPVSDTPDGFPGNVDTGQTVLVELPDGRKGDVIVTNLGFEGSQWTVQLLGTGPLPA
ncbi:hypothetical protein [Streptomyces sp. NPDC046978]|uniref:hypothetical protein n=1 Tax=Streptomyces sp. NPDC046978 TaxID=3154704 RepID=UPI0034071849